MTDACHPSPPGADLLCWDGQSSLRLIVFDIYGTLLRVRSLSTSKAEHRFALLWQNAFQEKAPLTWSAWLEATDQVIAQHHAVARRAGVRFPEIWWPQVVSETLARWKRVPPEQWAEQVAGCGRDVEAMPGAVEVLSACRQLGYALGIASNAQAYTLQEFCCAFADSSLSFSDFCPDLVFWSFEFGFAKPSPEIFQGISHKAAQRGISRREILMVGDRLDNDLVPAHAAGWQVWSVREAEGLLPLRDALTRQ